MGIVGAGIVGLATARALERRGVDFEIFEPGAPGGAQSRGQTRLFVRPSEDPRVLALVDESLRLWLSWQAEAGTELLSRQGVISFGGQTISGASRVRQELAAPELRDLTVESLGDLMPYMADPAGPATLDPGSGAIWARVAVGTLLGSVAGFIVPGRVDRLELRADGRITIHAGEIRRTHDAVVVAAGLDTGRFAASLGVDIPIIRRAKVLTTHALEKPQPGRPLPGFRGLEAGGEVAYGMPVRTADRIMVGFNRDLECDGDGRIDPGAARELADQVEDWVRHTMPGLVPERLATFSGWAIGLPWGIDAVGIWRAGPVLLPAGTKMFGLAPVLGEVLADAAEGGPIRDEFRPERFLGEPQPGF